MALSDYAHWNEDALAIWWQEEGRHETGERDDSDYPEPTGEELDHDDAYGEGYSDGEDGEQSRAETWNPKFRASYEAGYKDGSYVPEEA